MNAMAANMMINGAANIGQAVGTLGAMGVNAVNTLVNPLGTISAAGNAAQTLVNPMNTLSAAGDVAQTLVNPLSSMTNNDKSADMGSAMQNLANPSQTLSVAADVMSNDAMMDITKNVAKKIIS